jgi:hypothetical protein
MDGHHQTQEHRSQYPDPEESGLAFPWLDQYQPVDAAALSSRLQPIVHEGFISTENRPAATSRYSLRNHRTPSYKLAEEGLLRPSAVLEDSEEDPEFVEFDNGAE